MRSCSPCPAKQTTGPGRLMISLCTPPIEKSRSISASVATAAQPWPRHSALTSSPFGRSTIHSLLVSHDEKWRQWSLLRGEADVVETFPEKNEQKKRDHNGIELGSPGELVRAGTGQQHGLLGKISHGVTQRVGEVHGVVDGGVVKLHVDGVVLLVVVAANDSHRVPHLRCNSAVSSCVT